MFVQLPFLASIRSGHSRTLVFDWTIATSVVVLVFVRVRSAAPVHSSVELSLWRVYVSVETITHNSMSSTGSPNRRSPSRSDDRGEIKEDDLNVEDASCKIGGRPLDRRAARGSRAPGAG